MIEVYDDVFSAIIKYPFQKHEILEVDVDLKDSEKS